MTCNDAIASKVDSSYVTRGDAKHQDGSSWFEQSIQLKVEKWIDLWKKITLERGLLIGYHGCETDWLLIVAVVTET